MFSLDGVVAIRKFGHAGFLPTAAVAVLPCSRWWRCLPAIAAVVKVGNGRLHDMVTTWSLEVWLTSMCAFRPFSMHRSYSALNSAAVKAGGGLGQAGSSTLAHAPPLTMLDHVEETREVGGGSEERD